MNKKDIYGIKNWGKPFFEILKNGNIGLKNPLNVKNQSVDILSIVKKLKLYWLTQEMPMLLLAKMAFKVWKK